MTKVKCPSCQFANPPGEESCQRCRTPLPRVQIQGPSLSSSAPAAGAISAEVDSQIQLRRGQVIANRYTALDIVGRGGMGCIYRVRDNTLQEEVALKMLLPQFAREKMVVDRFYNEARIARQLSHPNIVRVHDIGIAGKALYISMEYLRGHSLRGLLDKLPPGQRLPIKQTLDIVDQLCAALEYAHQFTVHRDIKPENVMILEDGTVKLMDFGISKLMSNVQLTSASMVMGTPYYMSPEQLKDSRNVDARADIYSIGVMLYEILTGNLPTGVPKSASQLMSDIPPAMDTIVSTCVDPDPNKRYASVSELRNALLPIKALVDSGTGFSASKAKPTGSGISSHAWRKALGIVLLGVVLGLGALSEYRLEKLRKARVEASEGSDAVAENLSANSPGEQFRALSEYIERVRPQARDKAQGEQGLAGIVNQADALWKEAQEAGAREDFPAALLTGRQALQCYVAAAMVWPDNMVFIPPGTLNLTDPGAGGTGGPVLLDGFFIDKTEITVGQFAEFTARVQLPDGALGWRMPAAWLSPTPEMMDYPITWVTFYDAQAYAAWAGKLLPTEAQWAMAAYGLPGSKETFPWGDAWEPGACNTSEQENDDYSGPAPVGSFAKEGQDLTLSGCLDMAGNVSEWTRSQSLPFPYVQDQREDQDTFDFGTSLAVRGGNFSLPPTLLSKRWGIAYEFKSDSLGFRCVRSLPTGEDLSEIDFFWHNS